jgi:hypothetical protein
MTTQSIKAIVGSPAFARAFSDTSTDGQFQGNLLLSDLSSTNIGLEIPGKQISQVCMTYTAGAGLWRIQDSQTLKVSRYGFCSKVGTTDVSECAIPVYAIKSTDMLQCYPVAVNSTANDSEVVAWIQSNAGVEPFGVTTTSDNSLTEMTSLITGQSLGDWAFGKQVQRVQVQVEDGATLNSVAVVDQTGGTIWQAYGSVRAPTAGGLSTHTNLDIMTSLPIEKGYVIKVAATTA